MFSQNVVSRANAITNFSVTILKTRARHPFVLPILNTLIFIDALPHSEARNYETGESRPSNEMTRRRFYAPPRSPPRAYH